MFGAAAALWWGRSPLPLTVSTAAAVLLYPLVWYLLHLRVLFGALANTLPTILLVTLPLGWLIDGRAGAAASSAGLLTTCVYEFCHCIQHLAYEPKSAFLKRIKRLHLAHPFHNETGNFGITNFLWDQLLGTFYAHARDVPKSATVFNLGYAGATAERWPHVARLTKAWDWPSRPRRAGGATA